MKKLRATLHISGVAGAALAAAALTFVVPLSAPDSLHYNCGNHAAMNGPITILTDAIFASGFD